MMHTDFVSTLYAERANILSAQGLLSKRLVALDELLAVYTKEPQPGLRADNAAQTVQPHAAVASSEALPESVESSAGGEGDRKPLPDPIPAFLPGAGEVAPPPSASPATIPEAPTPLPEGGGQRAPTVETRPAEAKTSEQDALSSASGETQDRCESVSPSNSRVIHITIAPKTSAEAPAPDASPAQVQKAPDPALAWESSNSPAPTLRERVKALHDAHPEYTRKQAWKALGIPEGSLSGISSKLGIRWAPAEPPPPPAPPREDAIAPDETVMPDVGLHLMRPSHPKKGAQFRLRAGRGEGKYLHMSGVGMTDNKTYAWIGTEQQLLKLRQKFPDARELVEEVVEKEPAR